MGDAQMRGDFVFTLKTRQRKKEKKRSRERNTHGHVRRMHQYMSVADVHLDFSVDVDSIAFWAVLLVPKVRRFRFFTFSATFAEESKLIEIQGERFAIPLKFS